MRQDDQEMMILLILLIVGFYAYQRGLLTPYIEKIKTLMGGIGTGGAGGGGAIDPSGTCAGEPLKEADRSDRVQFNNPSDINVDAYEVTWCGTIGDQGEDLTFKLYGPSHSNDGDCCWCVMHVDKAGKMTPGGEGPHPSSNCEHAEGSKGSAPGASCYKATIEPGPIQKGYALVNGKWELKAEYKGPCGCDETSTKKTGNTFMVRCDGSLTTKCASWKPLGGGTTTPAPAAASLGMTVPLIPRISLG